MSELQNLPVAALAPSPFNPRKEIPTDALAELAESIKAQGVLNPLLVRVVTTGPNRAFETQYEIVAGERRWRAARKAGLDSVPCLVRALDDVQAREAQIIENLQRQDITPLEEAAAYQAWMKDHNSRLSTALSDDPEAKLTIEKLAQRVGKSKRYIYARIGLLKLADPVRKELESGQITTGHADELNRLAPALQKETLKAIHDRWNGDMTVRDLREHIAQHYRLDLDAAPWFAGRSKVAEDATLNAKAGACAACPKRAGSNPDKFPGLKPNTCTDPACFQVKAEAFVRLRLEKMPDAVQLMFPGEGSSGNDQAAAHKAFPKAESLNYQDELNGRKCKSSEDALVVASGDLTRVGRTLEICRDKKCKVHHPAAPSYSRSSSAAEKKAAEKRAREEKIERAIEQKLVAEVYAHASDAFAGKGAAAWLASARQLAENVEQVDYGDGLVEGVSVLLGANKPPKPGFADLGKQLDRLEQKKLPAAALALAMAVELHQARKSPLAKRVLAAAAVKPAKIEKAVRLWFKQVQEGAAKAGKKTPKPKRGRKSSKK